MGTHRNGPSLVHLNKEEECDWRQFIHRNPSILGPDVCNRYKDLPFLFKVLLSIAHPLSIQAHPDTKSAKRLHSNKPHLYPDALHKPEVAIALTEFTALCVDSNHWINNAALANYTQLQTLCKASKISNQQHMKEAYKALMQTQETESDTQFASIIQQINQPQPTHETEKLFLQLNAEFNGDIGCLSAFFFNKISFSLSPGGAIVMRPNEHHAYLSGECIECMAASDSVVRAGLTPKFKDVEELVEMLAYHASGAERHLLAPRKLSPTTWEHKDAAIEEFKVLALKLAAGHEERLQLHGPFYREH